LHRNSEGSGMTREEARKAAQVMLAYADGAEIEFCFKHSTRRKWSTGKATDTYGFDWPNFKYRVKQTPDFIDWSHVAPEYKWMARDEAGVTCLFMMKPCVSDDYWRRHEDDFFARRMAHAFASYKRGAVDWKDSLVSREEWEAEQ
jgi:hypothetical protein